MPADEKALMMDLEVQLPKFESDFQAKPDQLSTQAPRIQAEIKMEDVRDALPSLDDIDINAMSTVSSLIPSFD